MKPRVPVILCVDDEAIALMARKMVLERQAYRVLTARDAGSALDLFTQHEIDLVVTDHLLPGFTGTQLAAEMKRMKPRVPVVVLSGVTDAPQGIEHADLFICKGEEVETVLAKIAALLDHGKSAGNTASGA